MRGEQPWRTNRSRVLRSQPVSAEAKLWAALRNRHLGGHKFVRQIWWQAHAPTNEGRVSVEWAMAGNGQVRVRWSETGGPAVREPSQHGLGMGTIMSCGQDAFGSGQVNFDWRPEGLVCDLTLSARSAC